MEVNCTEFFPYARVLCHGLAKLKAEERQMKEKKDQFGNSTKRC
jgi:hypothetical protein